MTAATDKKITKYSSPIYDGRLEYHQVIKQHSEVIFRLRVNRDYDSWYQALSSLYTLTHPFIREPEKIKKQLLKISNNLNTSKSITNQQHKAFYITIINRQLEKATEDLINLGKDLFLKTKTDDSDEEIDLDAFMRDSET